MIRIFKIGRMRATPFHDERDLAFLEQQGIVLVKSINDCDLIVTARIHRLRPLRFLFPRKRFLIWTHEPHYNKTFEKVCKGMLWVPDIHVMNAYTGDIFVSNYSLPFPDNYCRTQYWNNPLPMMEKADFPEFDHKNIVALMGYKGNKYKASLKRYGKEIDLSYLRCQIALEGNHLGKVDVYGSGWPEGVSKEDSRHPSSYRGVEDKLRKGYGGGFQERKEEILKAYHFNFCFENTNFPYYCTEKIWDSIRFRCLPIYYGAENRIYEDFPKGSFLDYAELGSISNLFSCIDKMTPDEFRERMNLCIRTYNTICDKLKDRNRYEELLLRVVQKIRCISS
jgi:alpha(1,3/1,4) fucosyltransferase